MRDTHTWVLAWVLMVALVGCTPIPSGTEPTASDESSVAPVAPASPSSERIPAAPEVLWSHYSPDGEALVAVDAVTGAERVLVDDVPAFRRGEPSADGRWFAYERFEGVSPALYVVGPELERRKVAQLPDVNHRPWAWSSAGALLGVERDAHLDVIDPRPVP